MLGALLCCVAGGYYLCAYDGLVGDSAGKAAKNYGGGGGGAVAITTNQAGGAGSGGIIVVYEFG